MQTQELTLTGKKTLDDLAVKQAAAILNRGGVGVLPTDTLYGLVGRAQNREAVAKIYRLRQRQSSKPFIILIASIRDLAQFDVSLSPFAAQYLSQIWPGKISVAIPCFNPELTYLHRGTESLAFRLPDNHCLRSLIKQTGPLVAPSANIEGRPEAKTIAEAKNYFGENVNFYLNCGLRDSPPSTLIKIENDKIMVLRKGAVPINEK
jgi:L-threonylcarbamoyladenylate synthase